MKYTVILIVAFVLPVYGQEKGSQTASYTNRTNKPNLPTPQSSPQAVNVVNQRTSATKENRTEEHPKSYLSRLFAPENLPNFGLFVVGFVGVIIAVKTLRAIERQTHALVESQRPKILASGHGDPIQTLADQNARRVEFNLKNNGMTPAYDFTYEAWIEILPFPFLDFTESATYFKETNPMVLYPGGQPLVINVPLQFEPAPGQIEHIVHLRLYVCIRLRIKYTDAFGKRIANFGYYVQKAGFGFLPKYNDCEK